MTPRAYYNEIDPYAAQWLRNLTAAGLIMQGDVDERSIADVEPGDLDGYTRCHFFAGIAGWDLALQRSGWPEDRPVWTGSCPCQPFSVAGAQAGFDDPRHLWPQFRRLIAERKPATVFGEQVAGASRWLSLVRGDLEAMGYAVGAIPLEAASCDAEHYRDRYWFVADTNGVREQQSHGRFGEEWGRPGVDGDGCGSVGNGNARLRNHEEEKVRAGRNAAEQASDGNSPLAHGHGQRSQIKISQSSYFGSECSTTEGDHLCYRQYLECPDGKWRRLPPPGVRWLGTRIPSRVAKLRAFGNSIDPRPAVQFIGAYLDRARSV